MNEGNAERGWTLHKARPGTRNPTVTPTSNPYDSLRDFNSEGMPEPVQTPQPAISVTTTQTQQPPAEQLPVVKTAPTASKDITVVDYSFLDTMTESTSTKTIMDYLTAKDMKPTHNE